jgi:hypothetical protein
MVAITYGVARAAASAVKGNGHRKGLLVRAFEAIKEARMKQAEREIAMHRHLFQDWQRKSLKIDKNELPFSGK